VQVAVGEPDGPMFEGYRPLASWAGHTGQVGLGLMVGANTFRNPALVVKMITTLDHMSGGRMWLGIGGAWFETEHTAFGIEFGSGFGERLDWFDEAVELMRELLPGGTPVFGLSTVRGMLTAPLALLALKRRCVGMREERRQVTAARHALVCA